MAPNEEIKNKILLLAKELTNPTLTDLLSKDLPSLESILYILKLFHGKVEKNKRNFEDIQDFNDSDGNTLLSVSNMLSGSPSAYGRSAHIIETLLMAVRIHEVDAYEWVWLPPDVREQMISKRLQDTGVTKEELRLATSVWTHKGL